MPRAPRAAWPGGDGQFSARDWDLQVPLSPHGALPEVPTHSGPAAGSDQGCPQSLPHGTASPVPTCALAAPWPRSRAERWDSRSCHRGWHSHAPLHPQGPRARPAAPLPWQLPRGTGCAWDPPPGLPFHARSFQINILEPCRGGAGTPLALSSLSIPPGTAVTCPHGDLLPASAPRPVLAQQWLLLNQRRARGVPGETFCLPATERSWGRAQGQLPQRGDTMDPEAWQEWDDWGCRGSWKDPSFPRAREGSLGVLVTCSPPRAQGCPVSVALSPACPQLPPCAALAVGATGASPLPPRGPPAAVPSLCRALPRSALLPWWAAVPHPTRSTSRWDPRVRRPRGSVTGASAHVAACACLLPCSVSRRKKSNGNSLV